MTKITKKKPAGSAPKSAKKKVTSVKIVKTAKKKAIVSKTSAKVKIAVKKTAKKTSKTAAPPKGSIRTKKVAPRKIIPAIPKTHTQKLADAVVEGILELKGKNISVMNLQSIHNRVCDYFIICQADSNTQVNAIADSIYETVRKTTGDKPYKSEGFENSEWILVDYVTVVVHVFQSHIREFYNLESLWADAETTEIAFD